MFLGAGWFVIELVEDDPSFRMGGAFFILKSLSRIALRATAGGGALCASWTSF